MTDKVKNQILAIRETGCTNMFDITAVQVIAFEMGFYDLVLYLEDCRSEYVHFIMTGET